ncbi:MAG: DUF1736 domain-containing protein [Planctomycetota bacterium]|nr:DUF1736 domain-containing protein [Planctomycetota bacterium]
MAPPRGARVRGFRTGSEVLEPTRRDRSNWIVAGVCALAAILAFANTLGHGFVYDDALLLGEPRVQSLAAWREILTQPFFRSAANDIDVWRPAASLSFALDFTISGWFGDGAPNPPVFHVGNVLWHAAASALAGLLALRLGLSRAAALAAGLLFAVHPIHTEAVANVYQRQELLAATFGFAFLLAHRAGRGGWAGVLFLLALASKESALGFLPFALALDALLPQGARRFRPRAWIGPALALAIYLALRMQALDGVQPRPMLLENPSGTVSALERIATAARVQTLYLGLLAWPFGLSSDYSFDQIPIVSSLRDPRVLLFVGIAAVALYAAWHWRATRPRVAIAVLAYVCLFAVTSNVLFPIGTIAAERLVYAPTLAAGLLVAEALVIAAERGLGRAAWVAATAIVLAAGLASVDRNRVWADDVTLFRDQVKTAPRSAKGHLNLGIALQRAGDNEGAARALETSLAIYPDNSHTWYSLGVALYNVRAEPKRVVQAFDNALRYGPMHHDARVKLILVLLQLHAKDDARRQIEELARLAPAHPQLPELRARLAAAK